MHTAVRGIVIRTKQAGDDRLLTLLTDELGVIQATARGANKSRSRLASSTELFCYAQFSIFRYREHNTVDTAEIEENFFALRNDLAALALATYIAELCCELAPPEEPAGDYLKLLLNTLSLMAKQKRPLLFLKPVFELRLISMAGFMPDLIGCGVCGAYHAEEPMWFSADAGSLTCAGCAVAGINGRLLPAGIHAAMRHILYSPDPKLFAFSLPEEALSVLTQEVECYLRHHLQRSYRSLEFFYSVL